MELEELRHALYSEYAIYLRLREPLAHDRFIRVIGRLSQLAGVTLSPAATSQYWDALQRRAAGGWPWSAVAPRFDGADDTIEAVREIAARRHTLDNMVRLRGYTSLRVGELEFELDVFNPNNELGLPYPSAGEPIVAVLFRGAQPQIVREHLIEHPPFYDVLESCADVLESSASCATLYWIDIARAYQDGRLGSSVDPWSLMFELTVLPADEAPDPDLLRQHFSYVRPMFSGDVIAQVRPGLTRALTPGFVDSARVVQRTAVQELVPGAYDRPPSSLNRFLRGRDS